MSYNTRIAPSPSGDMHLGTARTAYFNWLAARATGGRFFLRIDDTNVDKSHPEYVQVILDTMDWLGLDYDELIYQSERLHLYHHIAGTLLKHDMARVLDNGAIALKYKISTPFAFQDEVGGTILISDDDRKHISGELGEGIILMRAPVDGVAYPTYHFASVVDDIDCNINYIIRGVDHITNTTRQIAIWQHVDAAVRASDPEVYKSHPPKFAHVSLLHFKGKKLSKRDGAASMLSYRDHGFDPDAMLNFMARLGWGPTVDDKTTKTLPRDRMLELFLTGGHMKAGSSNIDLTKLDSFDRKYKAQKKS